MSLLANQAITSEIRRETLSGLRVYTYDVDLPEEMIPLYKLGKVIIHMDKVYVYKKKRKPDRMVRYMILSNHMEDVSTNEIEADCFAYEQSYYKVLDVFEYSGRTLITLLHLYSNEYWNVFNDGGMEWTKTIVDNLRKLFIIACDLGEEVSATDEKSKMSYGIGMNESGKFNPLMIPVDTNMHEPWRYNFRYFNERLFYVQCPEDILGLSEALGIDSVAEGFIGYGFIDEEEGKMFWILALAHIANGMVQINEFLNEKIIAIRAMDLKKASAVNVNFLAQMGVFDDAISLIQDKIDSPSEMRKNLRDITVIDESRHPYHPDAVRVRLFSKKYPNEDVLVKTTEVCDDRIFGILLEEPKGEYGIHKGTMIEIVPMWLQGHWRCVTTTLVACPEENDEDLKDQDIETTMIEEMPKEDLKKEKRKKNELIYLSVCFPNSKKSYYYRTEDDSIEVGDYVDVCVGYEENVLAVKVVAIEYFTKENAPLAPEKTKMILGIAQRNA